MTSFICKTNLARLMNSCRCCARNARCTARPRCCSCQRDSGGLDGSCLSHVTRHTSHVTRHTSHVTRHTLPLQITDAMVIHGGYGVNSTEFFTDMWVYDFTGNRWIML